MPARRPHASFDPVAPDFDLDALVEETPNFLYVDRIHCDMIDQQGLEAFDKLILLHVVVEGKPLVVDGYQGRLDPFKYSSKWLQDHCGDKVEQARDPRKENAYTPLTIGHYLRNMGRLTDQYFEKPDHYKDLNRQRMYLKDIDCPDEWHQDLQAHLPPSIFYLNDNTGEAGGPGSIDETVPSGGKRRGRGIAVAGDLMSSLPPPMRAQNMMCYIGHEGTYTPAHREMCASLGHNIMVEASGDLGEDGQPERPGSSIWFMTESKDRHSVSEYWLSILGHDIEVEKHFAQIAAWKKAPFTTYVVEQKAGDFILIPPLAPHQVWNRGTRTMKAAWNRTTVDTLKMAFDEALPNARTVCRDEQYKNKAIVYYSLNKYAGLIAKAADHQQTAPSPQEALALRKSPKIRQLQRDFKKLFLLFRSILLSEMFSPDHPTEKNVEFSQYDSNVTCSYCRGNIFNRFLTCKTCDDVLGTAEPEPYDVCLDCYAMGRSCGCISKMRWVEQFKWKELAQKYEEWRKTYLELDGGGGSKVDFPTPGTLVEERAKLDKKTLPQICQEQLKRRPWVDVHKSTPQDDGEDGSEEEIEINEDGTVKKKKKKRHSAAWHKNHHACHVCCHRHPIWKMAECSCGRKWCYGVLFRGFDTMPQQIMEDPDWTCPHCRGVCFAGACRKDHRQKPYEPKGTLLGHDTRKVADIRSVESLVDFSVSNLNWLKETADAPTNNARLRQRQEEANKQKGSNAELENYCATEDGHEEGMEGISYSPGPIVNGHTNNESLIDPSLVGADNTVYHEPNMEADNDMEADNEPNLGTPLERDMDDEVNDDEYQPTMTDDGVVPEHFTSYPDVDGVAPEKSMKRRRASDADIIMRKPTKRRKPEDRQSLPTRKDEERKALEEARTAGRSIQTHAALKGKSRMVSLKLGRAGMSQLIAHQVAKESGNDDLLTSDIPPSAPPAELVPTYTSKSAKAARKRAKRNEGLVARYAKQDPAKLVPQVSKAQQVSRAQHAVVRRSRRSNPGPEDSGDDTARPSDGEGVEQADDAVSTNGIGSSKRRTSGRRTTQKPIIVKSNNAKPSGNKTTEPLRSAPASASTAPTAPVAQMTIVVPYDDDDDDASSAEEEDSVLGDEVMPTPDRNKHMATAAAVLRHQQEQERDQRAKLSAAQVDQEDEDYEDDDDDEATNVKGVATTLGSGRKTVSFKGPQAKAGSKVAVRAKA